MSLSLRDQLLKAGLVNEKQAKQAGKQQQKQQRLVKKGQAEQDTSQRDAALKAEAETASQEIRLEPLSLLRPSLTERPDVGVGWVGPPTVAQPLKGAVEQRAGGEVGERDRSVCRHQGGSSHRVGSLRGKVSSDILGLKSTLERLKTASTG